MYDVSAPANATLVGQRIGGFPVELVFANGVLWSHELGADQLAALDPADCPPCPADFNADGRVDTQDFIAFIHTWATERALDCSAGGCRSDLDRNGVVDTRDFVEFLNAWTVGC